MALSWGQGKIEVSNHRQQILDLLADGWPVFQMFLHFKAQGLGGSQATFYREIKKLKAELAQAKPSALPALASKVTPPKVSDQRSLTSSATPSVPSDGEEGMSKRAQFHLSSQRDPSELI
jgi:hypothetical protein